MQSVENTGYGPDLNSTGMAGYQRVIVSALASAKGQFVPPSDLVERVYGHVKSGGPDWADGTIRAAISDARKKLAKAGWAIVARRFSGYKLVRAS